MLTHHSPAPDSGLVQSEAGYAHCIWSPTWHPPGIAEASSMLPSRVQHSFLCHHARLSCLGNCGQDMVLPSS
ncbi:hypothetical protein IF1G_04715 [Cordyceps javanica]|uniref:Uncharacterized protein n=1 Tax=Cordyceps javanica TaxID=43265 RepID=A0A545V353_9HYPO|nr:hypothetical protein IF1G_04715 [Cordyceps javanica]